MDRKVPNVDDIDRAIIEQLQTDGRISYTKLGTAIGLSEAAALEKFPDIEYLVVTAGSFDLMCEVVVPDDSALLNLTNRIRAVPGVYNTETFIYLSLVKQTYEWGAH